jgi:hypothetical protein
LELIAENLLRLCTILQQIVTIRQRKVVYVQYCSNNLFNSTMHHAYPVSYSALLYSIKTRFSYSLSSSLDRLFVIVSPAQLSSHSDAALAGSGQFNCIKTSFRFGQAAKLMVYVDCECRYCDSAMTEYFKLVFKQT